MITRKDVEALVEGHQKLEEPMTCAVWIRTKSAEAWLVECIPSMFDDDHAEQPTMFSPGAEFRFPVALIVGNLASLEAALKRDPALAHDVSEGIVLYSEDSAAERLQHVAREVGRAA